MKFRVQKVINFEIFFLTHLEAVAATFPLSADLCVDQK